MGMTVICFHNNNEENGYYYTERRMKWQSQLFYCQFLLLPYLDVTPVSQQRASPIRAGPLCTKRHTFWLMAFMVDQNQIMCFKMP